MYRQCAVCHRTLLMGERSFRFTPGGEDWVDVCALCIDQADEHGWIKEGSPTTPLDARHLAAAKALPRPRAHRAAP